MKIASIIILITVFFIFPGQVLAEPHDHEASCPLAKVISSGNWEKLSLEFVENDGGRSYLETRRSANQKKALLTLMKEAHGWSIEYQDEDHGTVLIRERLPLKTKEQVKACAQFFTDPKAGKEFLDAE